MEKENNVLIVTATIEQKEQYQIYIEREKEIALDFANSINTDQFLDATYENYEVNFPQFSKEQLDSFPDSIDGYKFSPLEKILVLLDQFEQIKLYDQGKTFFIDKDNFLKQMSMHNDKDLISDVNKSQTLFKSQEILTPLINIKIMKNQNVNEFEVKGLERPLKVGDPVAYSKDGKHLQGKVESFGDSGETNLKIYNSKELKDLTVPAGEKIEPLFVLDKNEKMVYLKFTYEEVKQALKNTPDFSVKLEKEKNPLFTLMLGNKTEVIPFEKKIEDKMASVDGRLEMRRKQTTGEPYVFSDVKFKELNLERPIYGLKLDENQKNKLEKTGELGLVSGFKTTEGKDYNLWVSLDTKLNKVVTKRENDIYIDKIFGATPTEEQKNKIKSGEGALIEIKDKKYFIQASAATTKVDGLKSYTEEKAKEFKLISEDTKEEKKNSKTKGMKV